MVLVVLFRFYEYLRIRVNDLNFSYDLNISSRNFVAFTQQLVLSLSDIYCVQYFIKWV